MLRPVVTPAMLALALALITACGKAPPQPEAGGSAAASPGQPADRQANATATRSGLPASSGADSSAGARSPWVDPEPPGAQALAESVQAADWNRDKTAQIPMEITTPAQLQMEITTLVDRTSGIEGFGSALVAKDASLQERLARLNAEETATEVIIRLPGSVLFDFDSAAIRSDAERTLQEVAQVLASYRGRPVRLEGHTDAIASEDYNQKLSERRAQAVRDWLTRHGLEAARLKTHGFGKSRPIADNATSEGRQKNRRVEVIVEKRAG